MRTMEIFEQNYKKGSSLHQNSLRYLLSRKTEIIIWSLQAILNINNLEKQLINKQGHYRYFKIKWLLIKINYVNIKENI